MTKKNKYLFLDIDGVLVNRGSLKTKKWLDDDKEVFNKECIAYLNLIVKKTNCYIIISSSWRRKSSLDEIHEIFKVRGFNYCDRIIDKTMSIYPSPSTAGVKWVSVPRGSEIRQWLMTHVVDNGKGSYKKLNVDYSYAILDDSQDMLYEQRNNFVKTETEIGLTRDHAKEVISILNNFETNGK